MLKSVKELLSRRLTKKIKKNEEREKSPEDKREFDSEDIFADLERSIRFDASGTRSTKSAYRD
jgi:hypothetical protein